MIEAQDKLFQDNEKYEGQFVATPSFKDHTIICFASTMIQAVNLARQKGYANPVVVKIPEKGVKLLY